MFLKLAPKKVSDYDACQNLTVVNFCTCTTYVTHNLVKLCLCKCKYYFMYFDVKKKASKTVYSDRSIFDKSGTLYFERLAASWFSSFRFVAVSHLVSGVCWLCWYCCHISLYVCIQSFFIHSISRKYRLTSVYRWNFDESRTHWIEWMMYFEAKWCAVH